MCERFLSEGRLFHGPLRFLRPTVVVLFLVLFFTNVLVCIGGKRTLGKVSNGCEIFLKEVVGCIHEAALAKTGTIAIALMPPSPPLLPPPIALNRRLMRLR